LFDESVLFANSLESDVLEEYGFKRVAIITRRIQYSGAHALFKLTFGELFAGLQQVIVLVECFVFRSLDAHEGVLHS